MLCNDDLVKHLINNSALHTKRIIEAFKNVDRADFVLNPNSQDVYADHPLSIGHGQTISQPTTVAMMLEMLGAKEGDDVLDIGSGSAWSSALLSYIVGESGSVVGVERIDEVLEFGKKNLQKYNFKNTRLIHAKEGLGVEGAQFDRILVSAAATEFPIELLEQLKVGGKLVIPVVNSIYEVSKERSGELRSIEHYGFTFVPLVT